MSRHWVIVGGGAALAQPLMRQVLSTGDIVTAVCRNTLPADDVPRDRGNGDWIMRIVPRADIVAGPIDVLVTLTGTVDNARLVDMNDGAWDGVLQDGLTATFQALRDLLPRMRSPGNVVVVGSVVGSTGGFGCANYAAAKAGLVGLFRAAANEWASRQVVVNMLELGHTELGMGARLDDKVKERVLPMIPLGRFGVAEDFVQAVDFLSRVRWMTGNVLTLAGGMRGTS